MWKLIKFEFEYNKVFLLPLLALFPIYSLIVFNGIYFFQDSSYSLGKNFWTIGIPGPLCLATYMMIQNRITEHRAQIYSILPFSPKKVGTARMLTVLIPFVAAILYMAIVHMQLIPIRVEEARNIINLLEFYLIALFLISIGKDLWYHFPHRTDSTKMALISLSFLGVLISFGLSIYALGYLNREMGLDIDVYVFFAWGLVLAGVSVVSYKSRFSYKA